MSESAYLYYFSVITPIWVVSALTSENVVKLKGLLGEGWRITSRKVQVFATENKEKVHVVLEKANEKTFIEATNDSEFMEFTLHFKKFQDEYGNYYLVYVEDIKGYGQRIENLAKQGTVPKRPFSLTIGEVSINDAFLYHLVLSGYGRAHVGAANFFIRIEKNPDFYKIDFRDEVVIKWMDSKEVAFRGFPHEVYAHEDSIMLICSGGTRRLFQNRLTSELIGIIPEGAIYFVAKKAGYEPLFDGLTQPLMIPRKFKVIFPISDLSIPTSFKIEQVQFINKLEEIIPETVKKSKTIAETPWKTTLAFAIVDVNAKHYFDALMKAEKITKRAAVDWIHFRTDISLPCISENGKTILLGYNLSKSFSKCHLIPYGLAMDSKTNGAVFDLLTVQSGHQLVFHHNPQEFFEPLNSVWEKLSQIHYQDSESVQSLYEALSWLMQTFEIESLVDNLLQLWIAFEFICSREKVPEIVQKSSVSSSISSIKSLGLPLEDEAALIQSINQVNNPPLMEKWNNLLLRLGITLSGREKALMSKMRNERNNITHGKELCKVSFEDIEKFRSVLEKVFMTKVTQLVDSHYGIQDLSQLFI